MIQIRGLGTVFADGDKHVTALQDVSFDIRDREFLTIIGPSGCGKTTLLRNIAGVVKFQSGEILSDEKPIRGPGPDRAMVFQNFALLPWLTVIDNVAFGLQLSGISRGNRTEVAQRMIEVVGLEGFEHHFPRQLSGGMQQRVGLARALAVDPRYLLMDEPFGSLDAQTRRLLQEHLLRIWQEERKTVVFVTHSMDEAVLLGDRVMVMTRRPGTVEETIDVPFPRPRGPEVARSAEFMEIKEILWDKLREMQS